MPDDAADRGTEPNAEPPYVRVIGKAVAALEILLAEDREMTLSELARSLEMSRSTVHRLLATLERHRLVDRSEAGTYQLGLQLFRLGSAVRVNAVLGRIALRELEALAERLSLTSYLSVRDRDRALCVVRVDRGPIMATVYQVGDTLPLHVGAGPRILLAAMPDAEVTRIAGTVVAPGAPATASAAPGTALGAAPAAASGPAPAHAAAASIRAAVDEIRRTGVSFAPDDVQVGLAAMGVPVRDRSGAVVAAVSVVALTDWFGDGHRAAIQVALRETAARIEARLSG